MAFQTRIKRPEKFLNIVNFITNRENFFLIEFFGPVGRPEINNSREKKEIGCNKILKYIFHVFGGRFSRQKWQKYIYAYARIHANLKNARVC